jgi:class 3 adenylate cyclase
MGDLKKSLRAPDQTMQFPLASVDVVQIGEVTVGREVDEPGWRWSTHMRPAVGTQWCEAHHVGVIVSGRWATVLRDGRTAEFGPDDVFDVPPGHDAWTVGDEPAVSIEWSGIRTWAGPAAGVHDRVLVTLLFTDLVESTAHASRVGDRAWRELLGEHYEMAREALAEFRGRQVDTTGDGLLALFDGPALALRCAGRLRRIAQGQGLHLRAGVHVGEVEMTAGGVRGVAVHEAARVMAQAGSDEILVSETTRALALAAGLRFEDRGLHQLKGIEGERRLFALLEDGPGGAGGAGSSVG